MSYRNGVTPEPERKGRQPRHYSNNNLGEPSSCESSSALINANPTYCLNWGPRSSFSSRKASSTERNNEKKTRAMMDFGDNARRRRRSQSPSVFNNNRTTSTSNVNLHQKSRDKLMHGRHWDSLHMNIVNKHYHDGNHHGSFSSPKGLSSQNSPSYKRSRSKSQERSSRSSYYDSGNERKCSDSYQSQVEEFIRENLNASRHKSSKQRRDKKSSSPTRKKDLELLKKLLRVKDPDLEKELKKLAKEKLGKHSRSSRHKESSFSCSDYEQREHLLDRESEDRSPLWKSLHRSSSCSKSDQDWYKGSSASATKPLKSILKNKSSSPLILQGISFSELEDEDTFLYGDDSASPAKSQGKSQKESKSSGLQISTRSQLPDESDSDTNIADSSSKHDMWDTIHQVLNEQKQEKGFWQSSISRKVRDPIIHDKHSQHQDPTIKNILKSIGFDVEMSKRMQERAKQVSSKPEFLKTGTSSQQVILNASAEMDKGLIERTQMQILTIEKSLPYKDLLTGVPNIDTSVPPPLTNFPAALPPPPPLFPNRPPLNAVLPPPPPPPLPPAMPAGYGQIPPPPPFRAGMPPCVPFLSRQQPPFGAPNLYANVQPPQFDYGLYSRNLYYDSANSLASTSAQPPTIPSNLKATPLLLPKSDPPVPCATASASLPGFSWRDDRSPHSFKRHGSPKAASWSPEREWSPRKSQSPPPRRDQSPLSPRKNHTRTITCSRRSRDRSPGSRKERLKQDKSPLHHSRSPLSQRPRSPPWLDREKTPPKHDRSPPTLQRHSCSPTRFDSTNRGQSLKQPLSLKLQDTKSGIDANLDKSGSSSGDSVKDTDSLSSQEIEQMKKMRLEHISKVETLQNELNMLCKQQNELMRKKQRVKDGHKDPILVENATLQDEVNNQISLLKKVVKEFSMTLESSGIKLEQFPYNKESYQYSKHSKKLSADPPKSKSQSDDYFEKKRSNTFQVSSLDKSPPSLRCELSCESLLLSKGDPPFPLKRKMSLDKSKRLDDDLMSSDGKSLSDKKMPPFPLQKSSSLQEIFPDGRKTPGDEDETKIPEDQSGTQKVNFEYFDTGNHWCRHCNLVSGNIYELFQHLQSKKHKAKLDHYDRPWLPESIKNPSNKPKYGQIQMAPIKGVEFLMSTIAFYCTLCKEFSGDVLSADAHVKSDGHNITYQKYIQDNPYYEKRLNLDKAAGLQFFTSVKKERRKNIDDSDNEEDREFPKRSRREIKEKAVKEEANPEVSTKEETKIVETVQKEEGIEKSKESVEESSNKDPEIVIPSNLDKDDSIKSVSDELPKKEKTPGQPLPGFQKTKIAIKLTGKTGIKPVQYPVMPPWIPVGKMPGRGKGRGLKSGVGKKLASKEIEKPLSLDDFLTSSNKGNIPVVSEMETEATANSEATAGNTEKKELQNNKKVTEDDVDVPLLVYGPDAEPKATASSEAAAGNTEKKELQNNKKVTEDDVVDVPVLVYGPDAEPKATASSEAAAGNTEKKELQNNKKVTEDDVVDVPVLVYGPDAEPKDTKTKPSLGLDQPPLPPGPPPPLSNPIPPKTSEKSKEENLLITLLPPPPPPPPCYALQPSPLPVDQEFNSSQFGKDGHMFSKDLEEDKCPDSNEPPPLPPIIDPHLPPHLPCSSTSSLVSKDPSAKSQGWTQEDLDDMKLMGIDPASQVPMAEIRPPPLPPLLHQQHNETEMKKRSEKSAKDGQNTSSFNKNCSISDSSDDDKAVTGEDFSLEKAQTSALPSVLTQPKTSVKKNNENSHFSTESQELPKSIKPDPNFSLLKTEEVISSKSPEKKVNFSIKTEPTNEAITETLSKTPDIVKEAESIPVKDKAISHPEVRVTESKEKKGSPVSFAKCVSANVTLSGIPDVSSLKLQPTISLVPLPASLDMALSSDWEVPLPNRPDVLIRESEHNYALRLMENSDHVRHRRSHIQLHNNNDDEDDDDNDTAPNRKARPLKVKRNILNSKFHDDEDKSEPNSSSDSDSEVLSASHDQSRCLDSDDSTSPPVLTHEQEQSNLVAKHNLNSPDSPPSLSVESPCLAQNVALSRPSTVMPVTLICSSKCDSSALFTTAEPLCIDSTPILDNSMSILNFDSVVRERATKSTTRGRPAKKQAAGNKSSSRGTKKAATMKKKSLLEAKPCAPAQKSNQPELKLLTGNKLEQEKIIVKVTSHTLEGVPVISLTAASPTVASSSEPSTLPIATPSSTSTFTTTSETETGDTSLVEAAAKKAETLPKMFMPTVVLHDIKYTMGRDLSQMTAIPASIENIPIFESENESDNDVKSDSPKKSGDSSQRPLEIESPSKSSEAFDPYIFLNRPTKPSMPSTSSCTNHSSSIITCSSSHLVGESSSLTSIAAGGTSSTGRVTADSLPSLDHRSMVSSMFDVSDSKYAFPEVFLENGEPETSMKLSTIDVLGPELPFETSGKSSISLGLDLLTDFYPSTSNEETG